MGNESDGPAPQIHSPGFDGERNAVLRATVLFENATGEVRRSASSSSGVVADLARLALELGEPVRRSLGVALPGPAERLTTKASFPSDGDRPRHRHESK